MNALKFTLISACVYLLVGGCFVRGKDYRDDGDKQRTCTVNEDCFLEEKCDEGFCRPAEACLRCTTVPNGRSVCFHGLCVVEACDSGWHDVNGLYEDGCEYRCDITNDGVEICDGRDNNCNGLTDEDFDLNYDPEHCGECNNICPVPPNAEPLCVGGLCYFQCKEGFWNNDGNPETGCEATHCEETNDGVEICDLRDNNCNGETDEGFVKDIPESCGPLCEKCHFDNAEALCVDGRCVMGECHPACQDLNNDPSDGCEYCCVPTNGGIETCDGRDNNCNGVIDSGLVCDCPESMTNIAELFCMDIYEASKPDATETNRGTDNSLAVSQPGVMPWTHLTVTEAAAACEAAGKRLCTPLEWETACRGSQGYDYSYGPEYDPVICNGIDTFCNCGPGSSCEDKDPCPYPHCFWDCGAPFSPMPTGYFPDCHNEDGVYDITGNIWEYVQGGMGRGGAFNCSNSEALHKCSYEAGWAEENNSNFGFRCCCTDCPE